MLAFQYQLIAESLCFLASILLLNYSDKYWQTVRFYLGYIIVIESGSYYLAYKYHNSLWLNNLSLPIEYIYGVWMLSNLIKLKNIKSMGAIAYFLFFVAYLL